VGRHASRGWQAGLVARAGVCALGLVATPARGQTPSEVATAKRWFADGLASEESGAFGPALELFRRAGQVKKTPQIAYHIGLCESRTGALVQALVDLDTAAALARNMGADKVVVAAEGELADAKARVPSLEVHLESQEKPEGFTVDGHAVALSMLGTAMPLDPGEHTVSVVYPGGRAASKTTSLVEHDAKTLVLSPPPDTSPAPPAPPAVVEGVRPSPVPPVLPPAEPARTEHGASPLPWVLTVAGGVLTATGVVLFAGAQAMAGSLNSACPLHSGCSTSLEGKYDTARTLDGLGLGLGAVGIVAASVGVPVLLLRPSASTSAAILVGPSTGVAWSGRF